MNFRLECISRVEKAELCEEYAQKREMLNGNLNRCFGVSFGGRSRLEEISMKVYIDEQKEPYILNRLYREGRGGDVRKTGEHEYLYRGVFFDTNEMLAWLKTFTERILDIQGSSQAAVSKVKRDWERMFELYCQK